MNYEPQTHHRRSIRLKNYDYDQVGAYFVTICTFEQECLFGEVVESEMYLNDCGWIIGECWHELITQRYFGRIDLDAFVIMPNHLHAIVEIQETGLALGQIMRAFKSISAIRVNKLLLRSNQPLWQRNYYEHVVRNETDLHRIRIYIENNPAQWTLDEDNPANFKS